MEAKKKNALLAASVAGLIAIATPVLLSGTAMAEDKVPCYGVNKCKGAGDCGGKGHSCAGKNACKGAGYVKLAKEDCLKVQGGSLTPVA